MRNSVSLPQNRITQGTIFCGAKSPYPHLEYCHGICITARCDTARDFKAPSLTFLPVVPLHCWLWAEALPKAIADQKKAALGALRSHLIQRTGTAAILDAFGVAEAFNSTDKNDKGIQKQRTFYDEAILSESLNPYQWKQVPESIAKKVAAEGGLLLSGKIQDFHFIDDVEAPYGTDEPKPSDGFVVNFRDIRAISRVGALEILKGIDAERLRNLSEADFSLHHLYANDDIIISPTGELSSPYIEQLMQNFSLVFGRIGTKDIPPHYSEAIQKLVKGEN
ncbi:hypothetical protein [Burkholderia sp. WTPI3]|uniref:hypothetical protein n=1 Tax=Burkholderia sp. WTPI3 TaxID=2822167 RepID=UPI001F2643A7|nr:hypothetical protein [Burkholderia sp. WTPI3]